MHINNSPIADKLVSKLKSMGHDLDKIAHADHHEPFSVLGNQTINKHDFFLFYSPDTLHLSVTEQNLPATRFANSDFFVYSQLTNKLDEHYLLNRTDKHNNVSSYYDSYSFKPQINDFDLHLFFRRQTSSYL